MVVRHDRENTSGGGGGGGFQPRPQQFNNRQNFQQQQFSQRPQFQQQGGGGGGTRVYVNNLSWEVSWQDLKDHMREAGEVVRADVMMEQDTGRSKGCGIVEYRTPTQAQAAIQMLAGTQLLGREIFVREDREAGGGGGGGGGYVNQGGGGGGAARQYNNHQNNGGGGGGLGNRVFVGNLSWNVSWQDLKDHMRSAGNVVYCDVMMEDGTGRSKGCGIVEFETAAEAQQAIDTLTDTDLNGRNIWIREDREDRGPNRASAAAQVQGGGGAAVQVNHLAGRQLYVGNLSFDTTWQDLKDHFNIEDCPVQRAEVGQHPDGRSKGWGTIRYATPDHANAAIENLNGTELDGRVIEVRLDNQAL